MSAPTCPLRDFRAIRGAVTLKRPLGQHQRRQYGELPRHSWRGHIEARTSPSCRPPPRYFRAIRGAVTLKHAAGGVGGIDAEDFRAIRGAVTLKHHDREAVRGDAAGLPRHSWRGHIEARTRSAHWPGGTWHFRAIRGAVTLKPPGSGWFQPHPCDFRAIRGAVTLKRRSGGQLQCVAD